MPQTKPHTAEFAALTYELVMGADGVTTEVHLLPAGAFRASDGRPVECAAWRLDAEIAARVIARAAERKTDTLIDYEHQSLHAQQNGQKVVAAGWIPNTLEWREGKGLYAVNVGWTSQARREIADRQYRYVSTVFYYDVNTGEVIEIISVALTNTPALDGLDALAAMAREALSRGELSDFLTTGDADMALSDKEVAALTVDRDAANAKLAALTAENVTIKTSLAALTTENADLKDKVAAIEKEKAEAALTAEKAKHAELVEAALKIVPPAQKDFLTELSVAQLNKLIETSKPLAMLTKQNDGKGEAGNHGLSDVELAYCTKIGVTPEDYAKTKASS